MIVSVKVMLTIILNRQDSLWQPEFTCLAIFCLLFSHCNTPVSLLFICFVWSLCHICLTVVTLLLQSLCHICLTVVALLLQSLCHICLTAFSLPDTTQDEIVLLDHFILIPEHSQVSLTLYFDHSQNSCQQWWIRDIRDIRSIRDITHTLTFLIVSFSMLRL